MQRRTAAVAAGIVLMLLLAAALLWERIPMSQPTTDGQFSAEVWRAEGTRGDERSKLRYAMLASLERDHLRVGMLRQAVRALLGEPDSSSSVEDEYDLGRSPVGATYESYVVVYDASGRVTRFELRRR